MDKTTQSQAKQVVRKSVSPALVTLIFLLGWLTWVYYSTGRDPLEFARLGTKFSQGVGGDAYGYDGQFVYYIARDPDPLRVAKYLDVPAYRYQRILTPMLARALSFGNLSTLPWVMILIGLFSQVLGTWLLQAVLENWGVNRWYALVYGLYPGLTVAVRLDLPEPLAFALVIGAYLAGETNKPRLSWLFYGLALFSKEVTSIYLAAALLSALLQRRWRDAAGLTLAGVPFLLFQLWLWRTYGQMGIGSGGAMSTPFEWIPFMGLARIGAASPVYLLGMLAVFGPAVVFPALWGLWVSVSRLIGRQAFVVVLALFLNALVILFIPFSTFREPGALMRFSCGLVLAVLLFAARFDLRRVLNYSTLWLVLNVFLIKS